MSSMQQLTFVQADKFEWREVAAPQVDSDRSAIVKPLAVTRCDLDLYIATGAFAMPGPFAFGHEIAGEVVDVGDSVSHVVPGDRVIVPFQINCGECDMCQLGFTNSCRQVPAFSAYGLAPSSGHDWGGGLSDFVHVPYADAMLVKIPLTMNIQAAAAMSDNAVDGYRTVAEPLQERPGADVLVVGGLAQSVGLYATQMAIALGAGRVVYRDFDERRLVSARGLGAEVQPLIPGENHEVSEMFPIVVEAAGTPAALDFAIRSTEPCGICTGVSAGLETSAKIPLRLMYMKGIHYTASRVHARAAIDHVMQCSKCQQIDTAALITRAIPFSDAADAMCDPDLKLVFTRDDREP
ncbi:MAG: alcohol dehydrogenase catalytic domain-containing protein [Pseudomonadota bacterium]